jgi:hypothetical protein
MKKFWIEFNDKNSGNFSRLEKEKILEFLDFLEIIYMNFA